MTTMTTTPQLDTLTAAEYRRQVQAYRAIGELQQWAAAFLSRALRARLSPTPEDLTECARWFDCHAAELDSLSSRTADADRLRQATGRPVPLAWGDVNRIEFLRSTLPPLPPLDVGGQQVDAGGTAGLPRFAVSRRPEA